MIGKDIRANASFPVREPTKVAAVVLSLVILVFLVLAVVLASSVSI